MITTRDKINELFRELVPDEGKADTVAGEIISAICRIGYRYYNDGDRIGIGYGKETCNPAARYLMSFNNEKIDNILCKMWGMYDDNKYDELLGELQDAVLEFVETNPELKTTATNKEWRDYRNEYEDRDDPDDDEEYW